MHKHIINNIKHTEIKQSDIHGYGLFSVEYFMAGKTLSNLDGQFVSWKLYTTQTNMLKDAFNEWNAVTEDLLLVRPFRTKYSFINHSKTPNCEIQYSLLDNGKLSIVTLHDINVGEELTLDYRLEPLNKEYLAGHGSTYLNN